MSLSYDVLKLRDFRLMLIIRVCTLICMQGQAVIVGWQVFTLTHSKFMLGLAGLAEALPAMTCALFSGHVVDSSRPHRVYAVCLGVLVLNMLGLLITAGGMIPLPDHTVLVCIFCGIFISGIARSFIMPSSFSLLPQIVGRARISAASAWLNTGFQVGAVSGPTIAGLVYGGYGVHVVWFLPVSFISISFVTLLGMGPGTRSYRTGNKREPASQSIRAGWNFMLNNREILTVMLLDMFAVLFGSATAMLPAYADEVLHVGSQGLGALRAAPAIGAVISALYLAIRPMKQVRAVRLLWMVAGFGVCMIGFGVSTVFGLSMLFLAASGAFDSVSVVMRSTLIQLLTPDAMRGRVASVGSMFIISSNELGAFESGSAATLLGLVPSVVFGGLMSLLVVAGTAYFSPRFRKLNVAVEEKAA